MSDLTLFDLADDAQAEPDVLELRADDTAWTSCRHCQTLTTAAGIGNRGHEGPESVTCRRMLAWTDAHPTSPRGRGPL